MVLTYFMGAKGKSIRGQARLGRRMARIKGKSAVRTARITGRAERKLSKVQQREAVRTARAQRRAGVMGAPYAARQLHRATSPGGRKHRIYKGKKQKWSKKYGGWMNVKAPRRRVKEAVDTAMEVKRLSDELSTLKMMIGLLK